MIRNMLVKNTINRHEIPLRKILIAAIALMAALSLILAAPASVYAAAVVTPASGGSSISADTAGGAWTTLGAIVITEGAAGDIEIGSFTLTIPAGFEFNTASIPDVATTGTTPQLAANTPAVITASTITVTVTANSTTETDNVLTIGGVTPIQVRPTAGTPLASGNILMTAGTINGVDGATNFGTLTEVHGAATQFVIINPTDGTVDAAITVTVQLQDQYGNIVTTGADKDKDVTINADGSATGDGLVDITNGTGTKDISDTVAETVNLDLTDSETTGFTVTSTQDVVFAHGAASQFVIINPTDGTVDAAVTVTVQLQDQHGNIVTTGADKDKDVTINAYGSATGDGLVDITNGTGTKDISDTVAETVNLDLTDSATTGFTVTSTQDVVFAHGAASQFVIINPTDGTVDAAVTVTVQLQDQYGNIVTTGADKDKDVTLNADGSATGDGVVDITNGVGTKDISDTIAETVNLDLTDSATTGFTVTSTQNVVFAHGAASQFVIIDPTDGTVDAAITVTVQLQDQYGNIVTTGADKDKDVTLNADGSATGDGVVDITNGTGTKDISDTVAETVNLDLTDSETTGFTVTSTQDVVFAIAAIDHYSVTTITSPKTAGAAFSVTIQAQDVYDNDITTGADAAETINISFGLADAGATPTTTTTAAGTATVSMTMSVAQSGQSITFTGATSGKTGTSNTFTVNPAPASPTPTPTPTTPTTGILPGYVNLSSTVDASGTVTTSKTVWSLDSHCRLVLEKGTTARTAAGDPLGYIEITEQQAPPSPPAGSGFVGIAYNFSPDGATFSPAVSITVSYSYEDLPAGASEQNLILAYYDADAGRWQELESTVDTGANTITASISHFTAFAVLVDTQLAVFSTSDLTITPSTLYTGESVTISTLVTNSGKLKDTCQVTLRINNAEAATKDVTVVGGASQTVTFTIKQDVPGKYSVDIDGQSGVFTVNAPAPSETTPSPTPSPSAPAPTSTPEPSIPSPEPSPSTGMAWWVIVLIIAACIVIGLIIWLIISRSRKGA